MLRDMRGWSSAGLLAASCMLLLLAVASQGHSHRQQLRPLSERRRASQWPANGHAANWTVGLVVAACAEDLSFVADLRSELEGGGKRVTTTLYCKCGAKNPTVAALGASCTYLPNVGREYHSIFYHLALTSRTNSADVLFFVNGGTASKAGALGSARKVAVTLAAAKTPPWYIDGDIEVRACVRSQERASS